MKIIEAMKQIKANKEKVQELSQRIQRNSAHLSIESPQYENQADKIKEWTQSCLDVSRDNVELLTRIAKTNLATNVTIDLGGKAVTKTIAEWVWRRREYSGLDKSIWLCQGDRNLKEGQVQTSPGVLSEIKLVRYYDPATRDTNVDIYMREPHLIDSALEVVNATTELL